MADISNQPDERELRERLSARYAIDVRSIHLLRESGVFCYLVEGRDGKFLFRLAKPFFCDGLRRSAEILSRMESAGVAAPRLVRSADGAAMCEDGAGLGILLSYIDGRDVESDERMEAFGETAARAHSVAPFSGLPVRDEAYFTGRYLSKLGVIGYPDAKLVFFREYGEELWRNVKALPTGFCHGDMHRGNALLGENGLAYLIDWDTACLSYPSFDIAVFCDATDYFTFRPEGVDATARNYSRFLSGYESRRALTGEEKRSVWDWIALRHFEVQATILELFGNSCVDEAFLDRQRDWLMKWRALEKPKGD